ncbi:MAG: NAD(P)-binding protein, partial [Gammaproteobacteria bacterium]|nr:NAD(P)-binding protein [Gammaproteobacteria bacterium]
MNRRNFVRTVVTGVTMAGLPFERVYSQKPKNRSAVRTNRRHIVREPAHQVRDGHRFPTPPPSEFKDVVIVGAGANSLVAAYHLPDLEVVCLEKEARCGGNAQRSKWRDIYFTEGAAYTGMQSDLVDFMQSEFGIAPTPVFSDIGYIAEKTVIPSFYKTGFDKLPYDEATRKAFCRLRDTCNATSDRLESEIRSYYSGETTKDPALRTEIAALHAITFEQWLADNNYPGEVLEWCDSYCPTDSSAYPRDMSALSGINGMANIGDYDGSGTWPGGLAKMSEVLETGVRAQGANRVRTGTFVTSVENTADG